MDWSSVVAIAAIIGSVAIAYINRNSARDLKSADLFFEKKLEAYTEYFKAFTLLCDFTVGVDTHNLGVDAIYYRVKVATLGVALVSTQKTTDLVGDFSAWLLERVEDGAKPVFLFRSERDYELGGKQREFMMELADRYDVVIHALSDEMLTYDYKSAKRKRLDKLYLRSSRDA